MKYWAEYGKEYRRENVDCRWENVDIAEQRSKSGKLNYIQRVERRLKKKEWLNSEGNEMDIVKKKGD